jgi:uncharacterized protein (TIGR02271 family)
MPNTQSPETYMGRTAVDAQGNKIGSVGQVYVNDVTGVPDWITVNTGLFGTRENFAPLHGSSVNGDDLVLPFGKDVVKDAPDVADSDHIDIEEQQALSAYYQQYLGAGTPDHGGADTGYQVGEQARPAAGFRDTADTAGTEGYDTSGRATDEAMTRSEEHLEVGTQRVEAGRARLRKYVVTEQQTVTVPVSHEEVRVDREPITDANVGDAVDGPAISEEEHEVILHADRPVVATEAVPVERVRLGTETVTEQQQVSGEVRKEEIEVHDGSDADLGSRTGNR